MPLGALCLEKEKISTSHYELHHLHGKYLLNFFLFRNSSNLGQFVVMQREEDTRSDVWSVEVLASDSEAPDVQTDDRLHEFESEASAAVSLTDFLIYFTILYMWNVTLF